MQAASLLKAGHPVAPPGGADVTVSLDAAESDGGVLLTLVVTEKGQQTASFVTRFKSGASLQPSMDGRRKLVVQLPRSVEQPFRTRGNGEFLLDEIYRQIRVAIGSGPEVAEASVQVRRTASRLSSAEPPTRVDVKDALPGKGCEGLIKSDVFQRRDGNLATCRNLREGGDLCAAAGHRAESAGSWQ